MAKTFQILGTTIKRFSADNATLLGAGLSFYALFSLAPLLVFAIGVSSVFLGEQAAQGLIVEQIDSYVGPEVAELVEQGVLAAQAAEGGIIAGILGAIVVIYGAHNFFVQLRRALNVISKGPDDAEEPGAFMAFVLERALSIAGLFALGGMFIALAFITLSARVMVRSFSGAMPIWDALATPIDLVVTLGAVAVMTAITYRILPRYHLPWRKVIPGALFMGASFFAVKWALGLYLSYASVASAYGAAGSLVVFMTWVFFTALAYLFGAELNEVIAQETEGPRSD